MLKLDQSVSRAPLDPGLGFQAFKPFDASNRAESALNLALQGLQEAQEDALEETQQDLSFALGGRLDRRSLSNQTETRGRVLAQKLVVELMALDPAELTDVLSAPQDWQNSGNMLHALQQQNHELGAMALQLAAQLAYGNPIPTQRKRLLKALAELSCDDEMALSLFGVLEFGSPTPALRQELKRLYHRASAPRQKMSQWFESLGRDSEQRKRKLRTMLRVLAYDLSASGQPIMGSHLAAVIADLKQLLRLLSVDAHCENAARLLAVPGINGESLLKTLVILCEQLWASADSVLEVLPPSAASVRYRLVNAIVNVLKLLPDTCFIDAEQKNLLETAITELRDRVSG